MGDDGGDVGDVVVVVGGEEAPAHEIVEVAFFDGEIGAGRGGGGGDDGVVVGDLGVVDEAVRKGPLAGAFGDEVGVLRGDGFDDGGEADGDGLGEMAGVGSGVGDELVRLVESLGDVEGFLRAVAVEAVGVALEFGEIVEAGRAHALSFGFDGGDFGLAGFGAGDDVLRVVGFGGEALGLFKGFAFGGGTEPGAEVGGFGRNAGGGEGDDDLAILFGDEGADGEFAFDDHRERRGLHPSYGEFFVVGEGVGAGEVHADEPVGAGATAGGVAEAVVIVGGLDFIEAFADGVGGEGGDPEAVDGLLGLGGVVDVAEDEFAFASGVGGADDPVDFGRIHDFAEGFELALRFVVDNKGPFGGEHRKRISPPLLPFGVDFVGLGERDEVADGPGDDVAGAVEIAIAFLVGTEDFGKVSRDGGFFGDDGDGRQSGWVRITLRTVGEILRILLIHSLQSGREFGVVRRFSAPPALFFCATRFRRFRGELRRGRRRPGKGRHSVLRLQRKRPPSGRSRRLGHPA